MSTFITHHYTKGKFTDDFTLFNKWLRESYSLINKLVLANRDMTQDELYSLLDNSLHVYTGHIVTPAITYWVNTRGSRHLTVTMTFHNIGKIKYRIAVPSLVNDEEKKQRARYDIGELIGDISQDFYECSYNDDYVFQAWQNKSLNEHWEKFMHSTDRERTLRGGSMQTLFDVYLPGKAYDWELLLTTLYDLAQGWPTDWLSGYKTLEELAKIPNYKTTK